MMNAGRGRVGTRRAERTPGARKRPTEFSPQSASRALRVALTALFSAILALPRLRALRRTRAWTWLRLGLLLLSAAFAAFSSGWWKAGAVAFGLVVLVLRRSVDPDRERRLQREHGADYFLNGGEWGGVDPTAESVNLDAGTHLYLLLRGGDLLVVPRDRDKAVHVAVPVDAVERILVNGRDYLPVYVSEAKQPPVRERDVDRHAVSILLLEMRGGQPMCFLYRGAFSEHLAETAAHAIFSVRARTNAKPGGTPSMRAGIAGTERT